MKIRLLSVRDPVWTSAQKNQINCWIHVSSFSEEIPFTACPNDTEKLGREIFKRSVAGEFGEVQPYAAPEGTVGGPMTLPLPKWVQAWPEVHDFIEEANKENGRNSPRAIGLVWGSMLENMLKSFIEFNLVDQKRGTNSLKLAEGKCAGSSLITGFKEPYMKG